MTSPIPDAAIEAGARFLCAEMSDDWREGAAYWKYVAQGFITALAAEGLVVVPREPSRGLLISMAIRMDHAFVAPPQEIGAMKLGYDDGYREVVLGDLRKAYEEVVGDGFYSAEREDNYRAMIEAAQEGKT